MFVIDSILHSLDDIGKLKWYDLYANGIFFGLDFIVTILLLPVLIRYSEHRKWRPARQALAEKCLCHLYMYASHFERFYDHVHGQSSAMPQILETEVGKQKRDIAHRVVFQAFNEATETLGQDLEKLTRDFRQEIQILSPCVNSEIAINLEEFDSSIFQFYNLILGFLKLWHLEMNIEPFGPPRGGIAELRQRWKKVTSSAHRLTVSCGRQKKYVDDILLCDSIKLDWTSRVRPVPVYIVSIRDLLWSAFDNRYPSFDDEEDVLLIINSLFWNSGKLDEFFEEEVV